jgi:hypothetical protein
MEKNARIEKKKTPSIVSGKPCTKICDGEPLASGESMPEKTLKKLAKRIDTLFPEYEE